MFGRSRETVPVGHVDDWLHRFTGSFFFQWFHPSLQRSTMSALAIALVLIFALCHALRSLFTKESGDKQIFLWLYSLFALLFFSPLFFYFLYRVGSIQPVAYAWCFGSGFIHFLYWLFLTSFTIERVSYIVGLRQTSIVFHP